METGGNVCAASDTPRREAWRVRGIDAVRGLAVALMLLDHVLFLTGVGGPVRETVTRAAMPLFALLVGYLARRVSWRLLALLVVGFTLDTHAPWAHAGTLLFAFVVGILLVVGCRRYWPSGLWVLSAVWLTFTANGYTGGAMQGDYSCWAVEGLVLLGALLPRTFFAWGDHLPRVFALLGRYPLTVYAGHVLLFEGVRRAL